MTSATPDLWRGQSLEARAAQRRERLLDAGLELMGTAGSAQTTLRGVCRAAGIGLRYFYESFTDLDSLQVAVYDRVADSLTRAVIGSIAAVSADPRTRARAAFGSAIDFVDEDPRRGRILFRETLASDVLREHGAATVPRFVALVMTAVTGESPEAGEVSATHRTLRVNALSGALVALFLDRQAGASPVSREELIDYCSELTWAVIRGELG